MEHGFFNIRNIFLRCVLKYFVDQILFVNPKPGSVQHDLPVKKILRSIL